MKKKVSFWRWLRNQSPQIREWFTENKEAIGVIGVLITLSIGTPMLPILTWVLCVIYNVPLVVTISLESLSLLAVFLIWAYFWYWIEEGDC